jgi:enterochelin esterase-like enzyme
VYLPEGATPPLPEVYFTDGQAFLASGHAVEVLDAEIAAGRVAPLAAVFVDSRDPNHPNHDRRNEQFMCNADYARFFVGELLPEISHRWTGAGAGTRRALAGVSFGAINAACFGVMLPGVFPVLILHSPGSDRHIEAVQELYERNPRQASAFFLTHGGRHDNASAARRFVETLQRKGYAVRYETNRGRHDWDNWRPLVDDGLRWSWEGALRAGGRGAWRREGFRLKPGASG